MGFTGIGIGARGRRQRQNRTGKDRICQKKQRAPPPPPRAPSLLRAPSWADANKQPMAVASVAIAFATVGERREDQDVKGRRAFAADRKHGRLLVRLHDSNRCQAPDRRSAFVGPAEATQAQTAAVSRDLRANASRAVSSSARRSSPDDVGTLSKGAGSTMKVYGGVLLRRQQQPASSLQRRFASQLAHPVARSH